MLKNSFSNKRKTLIWMQSSMLLNQRSKQHFRLSKISLNKKISSIYQEYRNFLDGSRSCWKAIKTNSQKLWWIENAIIVIEKGRLRGLIDSLAIERYEKLSRLLKNSFSKKRKTQIWMQSSMLFNQRSKQYFKLSKTSLSKKMSSV